MRGFDPVCDSTYEPVDIEGYESPRVTPVVGPTESVRLGFSKPYRYGASPLRLRPVTPDPVAFSADRSSRS